MISTIIDLAIILLLIMTLGAGYRFHQRLKDFRADAEAFEPLISALDTAARRAETVLDDFRKTTDDVGHKLTKETEGAQRLLDELDFMTKRADQLAGQLGNAISDARDRAGQSPRPAAPTAPVVADGLQTAVQTGPRRRAPDLEKRLKSLR